MKGILLLDKKSGITSHDLVYIARRKLQIKRIGHTGTLDPLASGLMALVIGQATKIADYLQNSQKEYIAKAVFGKSYSTYDIEGDVTGVCDYIPTKSEIVNYIKNLPGRHSQIPPIYSAIKIDGKKLYEYARDGKEVEIKPRDIEIFESEVLKAEDGAVSFRVKVSKGTYIRSLINDMGKDLSSLSAMSELRRTAIGNFRIEDSIKTEDFESMEMTEIKRHLLKPELALNHLPAFYVPDYFYDRIRNGLQFRFNSSDLELGQEVRVFCRKEFLGIGYIRNRDGLELQIKKLIV